MASEQFSLCWDNFHKNMSSGMNSLLENEDLVDVTLAVEGRLLKAHKMVLSVCSPYFKELFKSNPCQHPIVFMKDVSYVAISDLLQFMYQGEVQVSQDNLTTFIKTAEALQIKGLTGDGNGSTDADSESLHEKSTSRHVEESYKPVSRAKKTAPAPLVAASSAPKRARLSASSASNDSQTGLPVTKTEPVGSSALDTSGPVQFKVEPFEQQQQAVTIPDDNTGDETFGDDTLDADNTLDDTEDYSMMEGDEPQAGTSTDGTGEGQGLSTIYIENPKPGKHPKLIVDGNFYVKHRTQATKHGVTVRWRCTHVAKTKCKAILYGTLQEGTIIKCLYDHNHPPNADVWNRNKMIPKSFKLIRSFQECKPGPVRDATNVRRRTKKRDKHPEADAHNFGKEMKLEIEGQNDPILIRVMSTEGIIEDAQPDTED